MSYYSYRLLWVFIDLRTSRFTNPLHFNHNQKDSFRKNQRTENGTNYEPLPVPLVNEYKISVRSVMSLSSETFKIENNFSG